MKHEWYAAFALLGVSNSSERIETYGTTILSCGITDSHSLIKFCLCPMAPPWLTPPLHQCMSAPLYCCHVSISHLYSAHHNLATLEYPLSLTIYQFFLGTWDHLILPHLYGPFSVPQLLDSAGLFGCSSLDSLKLSPGVAFNLLIFSSSLCLSQTPS